MSLFDYLGLGARRQSAEPAPTMTESVREIVRKLDDLPPERARFVAAFAYVLSRAAGADRHISEEETRAMERIVAERAGLPEEQAILVVQIAKSQNLLFGGTENYLVTRELNRIATRDEKLALIECLFAVSAADQSISTVEDHVVRQVAAELRLDHAEFIDVRRRFRDRLAVLKREGSGGPGSG